MIEIKSIMTGTVSKIVVKVGDHISEGSEIVILESMKMQIPINAQQSGAVKEIKVTEGDFVNEGDIILFME